MSSVMSNGPLERARKLEVRSRLLLTTALVIPSLISYGGRRADAAGICVNTGGSTYLCSGAGTASETINANNAAVTFDTGATIDTRGSGGNAITITGNGAISLTNTVGGTIGATGYGIAGSLRGVDIRSNGNDGATPGSVSVVTTLGILGGQHGLLAANYGGGTLTIEAATVTGTSNLGIWTLNYGTNLAITATGTVGGGSAGITSRNFGSGALTIEAAAVTGGGGPGIYAVNRGTDLAITTTGAVAGTVDGIFARNYGSGTLTIEAAAVTGTSRYGIFARNEGTDLAITATGAVQGGTHGIFARNTGSGALTIEAAAVTGTSGRGIYARNDGTNLAITATGAVQGGTDGVFARNDGSGALTIEAAAVTGTSRYGISAQNRGTNLAITATGAVQGGSAGIFARNYGSGTLTIEAAAVTGTANQGIDARNQGTDLGITATGTVQGGAHGIFARNYGSGTLTIEAAAVTGTSFLGIYARNSVAGSGLAITATGAVQGGTHGIFAHNSGTGAVTIDAAAVTGTSGRGIYARNDGTNLAITATGTVEGGNYGIYAKTYAGALTIAAADVTATARAGISAWSERSGTGVAITATGTVEGATRGIAARNEGSGALTIETAAVTGTSSIGIDAYNSEHGTSLGITATGAVQGGTGGLSARNYGRGTLTIEAATVTGTNGRGIYARNNGTNLAITATGAVQGGIDGIVARNDGRGALTIEAAAVTGTILTGINVCNCDQGTDLGITATGTVQGASYGIYARNYGSGALTIEARAVTGSIRNGISAQNFDGTDLGITATGAVQGGTHGISARNYGTGAMTIDAAAVTGTSGRGIYARNYGTDLGITATGAVQGGMHGIFARNYGSGALTIEVAAVTGTSGYGIYGFSANTTTISVTGDVNGGTDGIRLISNGATEINVASGASVTGGTYSINTNFKSASMDTVNLDGVLNGKALLGAGDDMLRLTPTAGFGVGTLVDGGADNDSIALTGTGSGTLDGAVHTNFEVLVKSDAGIWSLTGAHDFSTSATVTGGTLDLANGSSVTTPLFGNSANLSVAGPGAVGGATIDGNFTQTAAGTFMVDVDVAAGTGDLLTVGGTASLAGTVQVNFLNPADVARQVTILTAAGGATDNGLALAPLSPAVVAELLYPNANDVVLGYTIDFTPESPPPPPGPVDPTLLGTNGLNGRQMAIGEALNQSLMSGGGTLWPMLNALLNGVTNLPDYLAALDQLSPETILDNQTSTTLGAGEFAGNLLSCRMAGGSFTAISEGECLWVRPEGRMFDRDGGTDTIGFEERVASISAGAQLALMPDWFVGLALGYETTSLETDAGASSDGERFQVGGALKYQSGPLLLAATATGGKTNYETARSINFGGFTGVATSEHDVTYLAGQLRAAYLIDLGGWVAKPLVDVNVTHLERDAIAESGAGAANLNIASASDTIFSIAPAIEFSAELRQGDAVMRPFLKAGVTFYDDSEQTLTASFAGAPAGTGEFTIRSSFDDVVADIEAGITAIHDDGTTLSFAYEGHIGETSAQHGLMLKGSLRY
ncbi:MAG: autotransporter domain-containing protein [Rhizobiales bacterium]|nr:autotransporter domain-containing protein [Hyphomicrobiales bacterium]